MLLTLSLMNSMSKFISIHILLLTLLSIVLSVQANGQNEEWMEKYNFVYLSDYLDQTIFDVRYASSDNFMGRPVEGYPSTKLVMTKAAAIALQKVEEHLAKKGFGLKIFDTYRPQRAVNNFMGWSKLASDTLTKQEYYPHQNKKNLFQLGYISSQSGHSRGSTIDLTLYHLSNGEEVDMGSSYDFFGTISHHDFPNLSTRQLQNRKLLKDAMYRFGFIAYAKEWWHYTLYNEPYPDAYFDFVVK